MRVGAAQTPNVTQKVRQKRFPGTLAELLPRRPYAPAPPLFEHALPPEFRFWEKAAPEGTAARLYLPRDSLRN